MALAFSPAAQARISKILPRYPTKMAACLPVLWIAQEEFGSINKEAVDLVAKTLDLAPAHVYGVVTFYTMYNQQPVGKYHVQVCTNVSCMLCGGYETLRRFEQKLGIKVGETTPDKMFTLSEVECLAACGGAPAVQINDKYYEPVGPGRVDEIVDQLRTQAAKPTKP